jgi:hypothetical protein
MAHRALAVYLNDHLLGATFGVEMFRRAARAQAETPAGPVLERLAAEVAEDRESLISVMAALGVPRRHYKVLAGLVGERVGRLKLNGSLVSRAPTSDLVELEALYLGVTGKVACWEALSQLPASGSAIDPDQLQTLTTRGIAQATQLEGLRRDAARRAWQSR